MSAFKHSLTLPHTCTHTLTHSPETWIWHLQLGNSNYDNLKCISVSSRKCCILFSAYRQTTFSPTIFLLPHATHAGLPAKSYWEMFLFKLCVIRMDKLSANQTEKRTKLPFCFTFCLFVFCASIFEHFHRQQPDTHTHMHTHACSHTYAHTNGNK